MDLLKIALFSVGGVIVVAIAGGFAGSLFGFIHSCFQKPKQYYGQSDKKD